MQPKNEKTGLKTGLKTTQSSTSLEDGHPNLVRLKNHTIDDDLEEARHLRGRPDHEKEHGRDAESKSALYLFLLTLSIGGLQIVWSVELSHGSPYLLSLGMDKSFLAFVWIAGPLSGVLVQPYVGIRSDNCRLSWGKRKPFMVGGGCATIVALLTLGWTREIVQGLASVVGAHTSSSGTKTISVVLATIMMYVLDFSINTVQAGIRCFIVDNAPAHQQEAANAWASRITGIGNILGYVAGYVDLPRLFPLLGNTQFKVLCVIASLCLGTTLLISCLYIQERDPRLDGPPPATNPGLLGFFKQVFVSIQRLPSPVRRVCEVQFFNWMGWFPFLFYITTYIGQLYLNPIFSKNPGLPERRTDELWEKATRIGTLALLVYAIVSFASNIILPFFIVPTYKAPNTGIAPSASAIALSISANAQKHRFESFLKKIQIPGLTLRRLWLLSHVLFAICMFSTSFISTPIGATVMTAFVGVSWSVTLWAPFALISAEVAQREAKRREEQRRRTRYNANVANNTSATVTTPLIPPAAVAATEDDGAGAGIILGLHNVAVSSPQILASLISSAVFKALQKPRGTPNDPSLGWALRIGGLAALVAAWKTGQIEEG